MISIAATIFIIRLSASIDVEKYIYHPEKDLFEFIELIKLPPPPEPPTLQMEQVKELPKEELPLNEELIKELEALVNESSDEAQLTLAANNSSFLISESQMGSVVGVDFNIRKLSAGDADFKIGNRSLANLSDRSSLDIGKNNRDKRKAFGSDNGSLSLKPMQKKAQARRPSARKDAKLDIGITAKNEKILSFSSSMIGMEDYKVWNKINSELDRLNKGRYGSVPKEIQHHRGGFIVKFSFRDGVQYQINWQRNGNVWIKVTGESSHTNLQELRRALHGLIRLSL